MPELVLHLGNKNYSSWSLRAWLAAKHCGEPFREVAHDITASGDRSSIRAASPAGRVPFLRHGDLLAWDSLAICEYLAETFPAARLWPEDAAARAVARSACAEMHSSFQALRTNMPMNLRRRSPGAGRADGVLEDVARITAIWSDCRARFGAGGDLLFGRFTIADAFFAPVVTRLRTYAVEVDGVAAAYCAAVWRLRAMQEWEAAARAETAADPKYDR